MLALGLMKTASSETVIAIQSLDHNIFTQNLEIL